MDSTENSPEELMATLHQLRWMLHSLRLSGIENWASHLGEHKPADEIVVSNDQIDMPDLSPPQVREEIRSETNPEELLVEIREELGDCRRCRLHETRNHIVFGEGAPRASLVFVGEGPGFDEDQQGRPFVGRAGKLLDKIIRAIGLRREEVYICNVVKCRPPNNRTPNKDEVVACSPFLFKQLEAIHPQVICALGAPAAQTLLNSTAFISNLRGKIHYWRGIPLIATYHPAYLLRTPSQKAPVWQDLTEVLKLLGS